MLTKLRIYIAIFRLKHLHFSLDDATNEQLLELHDLVTRVQHLPEMTNAQRTLEVIEETLYLRDIDGDNTPLI